MRGGWLSNVRFRRLKFGIVWHFLQVQDIGFQWFQVSSLDSSFYSKQIALSRTFCIYEEVSTKRLSIVVLLLSSVFCYGLVNY